MRWGSLCQAFTPLEFGLIISRCTTINREIHGLLWHVLHISIFYQPQNFQHWHVKLFNLQLSWSVSRGSYLTYKDLIFYEPTERLMAYSDVCFIPLFFISCKNFNTSISMLGSSTFLVNVKRVLFCLWKLQRYTVIGWIAKGKET